MFADVKERHPGAALKLQTRLRKAAAAVMRPQHGSSYPSRPPQAHISPSSASQANLPGHSSLDAPLHGAGATNSHPHSTTVGSATVNDIPATAPTPRYVLLCVNTRRLRTLEHVSVPDITNDQFLFDVLREGYTLARKTYQWTLPLLPYLAPLSKWIWGYGSMSILTPTSADYVRICRPQNLSQRIRKQMDDSVLTLSVPSRPDQNRNLSFQPNVVRVATRDRSQATSKL